MNIIDYLLGKSRPTTPIISPQEAAMNIMNSIGKNYIYDPTTKRLFPQSIVYPENLPQFSPDGTMSREQTEKAISLVSGMVMPAPQAGRAIPVQGMESGFIQAMPRNVMSIMQAMR